MKNENTEMKKEKKGFLSALLNRIRPDKNKDKKKEDGERKKSGSGGTF